MKNFFPNQFKNHRVTIIQCAAVFVIGITTTAVAALVLGRSFMTAEGFDFTSRMNRPSSGPMIGESLDLQRLKSRDGRSLVEFATGSSAYMLAIIDPNCPASKVAKGQMSGIKERLSSFGIPYYLVMLTESDDAVEYFDYSDSFGLGSIAFMWRKDESQPPLSLIEMVVPSHLLVDPKGTIMEKWPGTHQDPVVRQRMVNQIILDVTKHIVTSN